jgi:deoxyribonuclease V
MRGRVERHDRLGPVRRVAGADVAYGRSGRVLCAAVVVMDARTLEVVAQRTVAQPVTFPYVPGFLTLREAPAVEEAFAALHPPPDLLLVDAHGVAHPRGFGLVCHLGVVLDLPTIGVAKTVLVGAALPPGPRRGDRAPLLHHGEVVGAALRTRAEVAPVYVSTGHRVSLPTALRWTLALAPRFRLPEPARRAHAAATSARALLP